MSDDNITPLCPTMLPLKEVSKRSGFSYSTLRRLCLDGKIVFIRCGNKYLINYEKFLEFLNSGERKDNENNQK